MIQPTLIRCHFTLEELEYLENIIKREQVLAHFASSQIYGLEILGVKLIHIKQPNIFGKLQSYIKKGKQ